MCAGSFADLALNNRDNTLRSYLEEKFLQTQHDRNYSTEESQEIYSKSSTESDASYDPKMKSESFSSSTDTLTPILLINQDVIRNLEYSNSKTEKLYILNAVLNSQIDAFYYEDLFRILREYLNECDTEIFEITLEIHEKCINSSWELSKDAFINLLEALYLYYCSLECDIYVDRYPYRNAFKIFKLVLNTFNRIFLQIPRYGYRRLEKIIGNFVDLLFVNMPTNDCSTLTPINMIACLDTNATWCKVLVHGAYTREILFKGVKRNVNLVKYFFVVVADWMNDPHVPKSKRKDIIPQTVVKYITFIHAVFMCNSLCKFRYFNELFPVTISENNIVISLNSFTVMFTSFLKTKSKILPARVNTCMVECAVHLLQFHQPESMIQNVQNILESARNKSGKKHSLEIVKLLFDNELMMHSLINSIIHTRRSRAGLTSDDKLLRPRPRSVLSSRNNVFTMLINLAINTLRNSNNINNLKRIFHISIAILRCHEFYLLFGNNYSLLMEFMELLLLKYENKTDESAGSENTDDLMLIFDKLLFTIESTPIGFQFLSKMNDGLLQISISILQNKDMSWYYMPWKTAASFVVSSEYELNLDSYYEKINLELLQLTEEVMKNEHSSDHQLNGIVEKIFICIDSLSYGPSGITALMNPNLDCAEYFESGCEMRNFNDFIKKYALNPNYEFYLQNLALQCLRRMARSTSSRIYLLCSLNYEENLQNVHANYTSSNGEIILDECSISRTELLNENFSSLDFQITREKFSANRSGRKSSAAHTLTRKKLSEVQKFLQETKHGLYDNNWLRQARKAFKASLNCSIKMSVFIEMIEKSAKLIVKPGKIRKFVMTDESAAFELREEDYKGIELAVRYGVKNHVLQQNPSNEENLAQIFKVIKSYSGYQTSEKFCGFDSTLATLFIMCCGSVEKCLQIVSYIVPLPVTVFIWPQATPNFVQKRYMFGHLLEWLLYQEVPHVFSALSVYGISWWLICKCHLNDCFWNSMDWTNICRWLSTTILYPPDNLMYFFTSVAFKNESKIVQTTSENDLRSVLHVIFNTYHLGEHLLYIDYLSKKYHFFISSHFID